MEILLRYCEGFDLNLPKVFCLGDKIGQVFHNLLMNDSLIRNTFETVKHHFFRLIAKLPQL